ncbi:uncharacterized protein A4U43_C04F4680 [Asparagus officinalis]|uniref:Uncharacterized protein n=1 Tax=Asparagus officinalis TaxID=4686 RepID=A0A5P1EYD1_ASPOF|nr:uncharacterized protein LOC109836622 [Asparagus officinalis]XP_020260169.1 uncharacterized protein LOC109836622 [Asparagus officinalis]ONK71096.1 uncharacterized protein A4U43_C04F4680 [Asparagus officinalis]
MEDVLMQSQITNTDKAANVILDIESLTQPSDRCSGSPKVSKALSRKGSNRMERRCGEDQETDDTSKKLVVKVVCSQLDHLKQPLVHNKSFSATSTVSNNVCIGDSLDGRNKRFNRLTTINPRKILLLFASMSSMGTLILIYFTLAINRHGGD